MAALDAALAGEVPAASRVFAPAVLGVVHPDHLVVRDYALRLASAGIPVELYADVPYAVQFGWPPWVSGDDPDPHLDPEVAWRACPADLPNLLTRERARVAALDPGTAAAKLEAMRCYASQFAMLDQGPVGRMRNPRIHGFEVFWPARG
jgi:LmbE family N-acetylglucosaminyl deacetylase